MALITCKECSKEYSDQSGKCVHCGARNPGKASAGNITLRVFLGAAAILVSIVLFANSDPNFERRLEQRDAIARCDARYAEMKEDPRTTRQALEIIYGACDSMKKEFRKKWQREP